MCAALRRRYLLHALGGAASLSLAGCLSSSQPTVSTPSHVSRVTFELTETAPKEGAPQITVDGQTVTVVGVMWTGNPCYEAALTRVTMDEDSSRLRIIVGVGKSEFHPDRNLGRRLRGGGCPDSVDGDSYRVTVEFPSVTALPRIVEATHRPEPGSPQTTTTQVS